MFHSYQALARLLLTAGEVRGRKKLQKMVFIAQNLGFPFSEPFELHVWGPYSEVLAVKLKEMVDWGFAAETVLPGPAGNQHYVYTPGPHAHRVAGEELSGLASLVSDLNGRDATFLEGVATALYLRGQGKTDAEVRDTLPRLKPDKFSDPGRVEAVIAFLDGLEDYRIPH
ncbi:MAG: YwgA family protein [Bacillota bacterium]